jgi:hypothetical protein
MYTKEEKKQKVHENLYKEQEKRNKRQERINEVVADS